MTARGPPRIMLARASQQMRAAAAPRPDGPGFTALRANPRCGVAEGDFKGEEATRF